jgi:hypothetical protein
MLFSFQVGGDDDRIRKRTTQGIYTRVACFGSKAALTGPKRRFRFAPINGHRIDRLCWFVSCPTTDILTPEP